MGVRPDAHEDDVFTLEYRSNVGLIACLFACVAFWAAFAFLIFYVLA